MTDLTAARLREVMNYDPDTGRFFWNDRPAADFNTAQGYGAWKSCCMGKEAGGDSGNGYRRICVDNKSHSAHRAAWLYVYGKWPSQHIDHINGNGQDNRISNLRDVSNTENHRNTRRSKANTSGVLGVRLDRYGKWCAVIWADAKVIRLGKFSTKKDAVAARKDAELRLGYHPNHGRAA